MSPVFRHGALRLYLLKLLGEQPRHGYEVISLLEDRFMGLYAPSAGTVYPRLAKLESEGLVEHEEADGRKVYRLTPAGREELDRHTDELRTLEADLTRSVSELAKDVRSDVRTSVRDLRDELKAAAREVRRESRVRGRRAQEAPRGPGVDGPDFADAAGIAADARWFLRDVLSEARAGDGRRAGAALTALATDLSTFLRDVLRAAKTAGPGEIDAAREALAGSKAAVLAALQPQD